MLDEPLRFAVRDGVADVLELEERGPRHEHSVSDSGDQGDEFLDQGQSGVDSGGGDHAGDVDEFAVVPVGAGGDRDVAAGAQDGGAAVEDLGESFGWFGVFGVGEVAGSLRTGPAAIRPGRG